MITLLNSKFDGNQSSFAAKIDQQSSVISRVVNTQSVDHRGIGNKFARAIEQKLGLPINWMDNDNQGISLVSSDPQPYIPTLDVDAVEWVSTFIDSNITLKMMEVRDAKWKAKIFIALYDLYHSDDGVKKLNESTIVRMMNL
jgi:hypothetical protein